jgi:heptosyltransferase-2
MAGMKKLPPLFFSVRLPTLLAMFWRAHIAGRRVAPARKGPLTFIIFRLDSLGDVVMTTPFFRALKTAHPASRCTLVVQEQYKPLLVTNPHIGEILTLPEVRPAWLPQGLKRLLAATVFFWTRLRHRQFDFAISPRWDVDEHLATFLCVLTHALCRIGYSETASPAKRHINRGFDRAYELCLPSGPVRHEILRNLTIAETLGATVTDANPVIRLTDQDRDRAARLLARVGPTAKLVAVGIGAASPSRQWPMERYAQTMRQFAAEHAAQFVIVCSAAELELARGLERLLPQPAIVLSGAPLREVCAVLERCDLFIGNDSGCAHLAAAMGCGVVVISRHPRDGDPNHFNSPLRFTPHGLHVRVLQPVTGLDDCRQGCQSRQPHCITQVSVDEVVAAARSLLHDKPMVIVPFSSRQKPGWPAADRLRPHSIEAARVLGALRSGPQTPLPH